MSAMEYKVSHSATQATRTAPSVPTVQYLAFTPIGAVSCRTIDEVRKLAADFKLSEIRERN